MFSDIIENPILFGKYLDVNWVVLWYIRVTYNHAKPENYQFLSFSSASCHMLGRPDRHQFDQAEKATSGVGQK